MKNKGVLNMLLSVENLSMTFDKKTLYSNASFKVFKNDKIGVVGQNGVGKSTLLKLIVGQLKPMLGEIVLNQKTEIGYYAQEHELLDNEKIILETG